MSLQSSIEVVEHTRPLITKQLLDFRNDTIDAAGGISHDQDPVDIADYTFQLIIKRTPIGLRSQDGYPQVYDDDTSELKYTGTIANASLGTFTFQLDRNATSCYGEYVAEIRWWNADDDTSGPPTDRVLTTFNVQRALDTTYP